MSSVTRRPRVKCVTSACIEGAVSGCVKAVGMLVRSAIRAMDAASQQKAMHLMQTIPAKNTRTILPASTIREQLSSVSAGIRLELAQEKLSAIDASKIATL